MKLRLKVSVTCVHKKDYVCNRGRLRLEISVVL